MKRRAALCAMLAFALSLVSCKKKEATLSLLVWEGYADPSFVHEFEEAHHCKVAASYMGSSDELISKLRGERIEVRRDLAFERRGRNDRAHGACRAAGHREAAVVRAAFAAAAGSSAGQSERTGVRRAFHVGAKSAALRYDGVRAGAGFVGRAVEYETQREDFGLG